VKKPSQKECTRKKLPPKKKDDEKKKIIVSITGHRQRKAYYT
jgi:hypothetical protein